MYVESGYDRGSKLRINPILDYVNSINPAASTALSGISSREGFVHIGRLRMQKEHHSLPIYLDVAQCEWTLKLYQQLTQATSLRKADTWDFNINLKFCQISCIYIYFHLK